MTIKKSTMKTVFIIIIIKLLLLLSFLIALDVVFELRLSLSKMKMHFGMIHYAQIKNNTKA